MTFFKTCIVFQKYNNRINRLTFMMDSWPGFVSALDFYFQENQSLLCDKVATRILLVNGEKEL